MTADHNPDPHVRPWLGWTIPRSAAPMTPHAPNCTDPDDSHRGVCRTDRRVQPPAGVDAPGGHVAPAGLGEAVNVALSVWSNTCNAYCDEEDRTHGPACLLASELYERLRDLLTRAQAVAVAAAGASVGAS